MNTVRSQLRHSKLDKLSSRRAKPKLSADYVVGLTDGEGCFYILIKPPFNHDGGAIVQLSFFIKMQEEDKELLHKVSRMLKCGKVYFQHEKRKNHCQCYRYTVNSHRDIIGKIIPFFRKYPLQGKSKRRNFMLFCKIAEFVSRGAHHSQDGLRKMQRLKSQMNSRARVVRESRSLRGDAKHY